ncbi:MAG: peptide-methionine (S)-S-oxide reductase MsrA [Aliidongia sp.]
MRRSASPRPPSRSRRFDRRERAGEDGDGDGGLRRRLLLGRARRVPACRGRHCRGLRYAGGARDTAHYEQVEEGDTGHAETVEITYDPHRITYGKLLQIYFSVAHDPTELNRQGPDSGPAIPLGDLIQNPEQEKVAAAYVKQLDQSGAFSRPIATKLEPFTGFYPAEAYHQDFLTRNPTYPYIAINDLPKVRALQKTFAPLYRDKPVLVSAATD